MGRESDSSVDGFGAAFSKHPTCTLPRNIHCMKGWRRSCPNRSKKPHGWAVRKAIAVDMARRGHGRPAIGTLMMVAVYLRVRELLSLKFGSLMAPTCQGVSAWTLILFPSEKEVRSKTGQTDDTVPLDAKAIQFLAPLFKEMSKGNAEESLIDVGYLEFFNLDKSVCRGLGLQMTPSKKRHSGTSIDRALKLRTLGKVRRMRRWGALKSVSRYEKMARLNQTWSTLSGKHRVPCEVCERGVEGATGHGLFPPTFQSATSVSTTPVSTDR